MLPLLLLVLALPTLCLAAMKAVTLQESRLNMYSKQPHLKIAGDGLEAVDDPSKLQVALSPSLPLGAFEANIAHSGGALLLLLDLNEGHAWVDFSSGAEGNAAETLTVESISYDGFELLAAPAQIGTVVPTPEVSGSEQIVFNTATPALHINGAHFNPKRTSLYFDPPLREGEDFTMAVPSPSRIVLTKRFGAGGEPRAWRTDGAPGPLRLLAINTGGGMLTVGGSAGLQIAQVQSDLAGHKVTVAFSDPEQQQRVYQSSPTLEIRGEGFAPDGATKVQFANRIAQGANFTIAETAPDLLTLKLEEGSKWRWDALQLPAPLAVTAVDVGDGSVAQGPPRTGVAVATVFEDPAVDASDVVVHRTHTHSLMITGRGFTDDFQPVLEYEDDPGLEAYVQVHNRTHLMLMVIGAWLPKSSGLLKVASIDTGAGRITFTRPITVAQVVEDAEDADGLSIAPLHAQVVYESAGPESSATLAISGSGFTSDMKLEFEPALTAGDDYEMDVLGPSEVRLRRQPGTSWPSDATGTLRVTSITAGGRTVPLGGGAGGIKVATVLRDPSVSAAPTAIYASHTRVLRVAGSGLVSRLDPALKPRVRLNVPKSAYIVGDWGSDHVTLRLAGSSWDADGTAEVRVLGLDTGAGEVVLPDGGVLVARVQPDNPNVRCDDSCTFANDNFCHEEGLADTAAGGMGLWGSMSSYGEPSAASSTSMGGGGVIGAWYKAAVCEVGTDCTDCNIPVVVDGTCANTCKHARDDQCDDEREGGQGLCRLGTDCQDCGPVGASNFTADSRKGGVFNGLSSGQWGRDSASMSQSQGVSAASSQSWQEDSTFFRGNDVLKGQEGNAAPPFFRHAFTKRHKQLTREAEGAEVLFQDALWGVVLLVGGTASALILYLAYRNYRRGGRNSSPETAFGLLPQDPYAASGSSNGAQRQQQESRRE